jgi:hypothetical protein
MHETRIGPLLRIKYRHLALYASLSLIACAVVLCSCAGNRGRATQPGQSGPIDRASTSIGQDDLNVLIDLARSDMARRLGVRPGEVAVQGTEPLSFPPAPAGAEGTRQSGYVIRLSAGSQECQYAGRPIAGAYVLWRETQ